MKIGDRVVYVDEDGEERNALVNAVNGAGPHPSLNLIVVSKDTNKTDTYGRQIEHETSAVHQSNQSARGRYWK